MHLRSLQRFVLLLVFLYIYITPNLYAQGYTSDWPYLETRVHDVGLMRLMMQNNGGLGYRNKLGDFGWIGGDRLSAEMMAYPKSSRIRYGLPYPIIGGIVEGDTAVAMRYFPATQSGQRQSGEAMSMRSLHDVDAYENGVRAEEEITCYYSDTIAGKFNDTWIWDELIPYNPLNVRIKQKSYAWGYRHVDDIIFIEYEISNIGAKTISECYISFWINVLAFYLPMTRGDGRFSVAGNMCGYFPNNSQFTTDTVECAAINPPRGVWLASTDGTVDTKSWEFDHKSPTGAVSTTLLYPTNPFLNHGFNWWMWMWPQSFGPRKAGTPERPFRRFEFPLAAPGFEEEFYYVMSSGEIDYDQLYMAQNHKPDGWLAPPYGSEILASGANMGEALLTVGPYNLSPGQTVKVVVAYTGSEDFHTNPRNFQDNWNPNNPDALLRGLDFPGHMRNVTWARWTYDNPGFDTDGDGYRGNYSLCERDSVITRWRREIDSSRTYPVVIVTLDTLAIIPYQDTVWTSGDGFEDYRPVVPPMSPEVRFSSQDSQIILEWNGAVTETTPDLFTRVLDFEGYRVYIGLTSRRSDLVLASSYDHENFTQWFYKVDRAGKTVDFSRWEIIHKPFTADEARVHYANGSLDWHPLDNDVDHKLNFKDSLFYFTKQDYNQSDLTDTTAIHKIYPNAPKPHTLILDSAFTEDTWYTDPLTDEEIFYEGGELTPDGKRFKYYEYRYIFENLLPSQQYYVAVTAFDFGSPESGIPFLETNPSATAVEALAQDRIDQNEELDVIVYPNPYRADANYRATGFEGRGREAFIADRVRAIHFSNLPPQCEIRIYSLDGDLVRQLYHDKSPDDPSAMHEIWDVITRNLQKPASGIYYWVVETPEGRQQIGKLVLIM